MGLVLAGGTSRRFGRDKRIETVGGHTLVVRALTTMGNVLTDVRMSCATRETALDVPVPIVLDRIPDAGPLAGIHAGFQETEKDFLIVLACDLPNVTAPTLRGLLEVAAQTDADIVVARAPDSGRIQPLCGVYLRAVNDPLEAWLLSGKRSVLAFLATQFVEEVDVPESELLNLNRPEDRLLFPG